MYKLIWIIIFFQASSLIASAEKSLTELYFGKGKPAAGNGVMRWHWLNKTICVENVKEAQDYYQAQEGFKCTVPLELTEKLSPGSQTSIFRAHGVKTLVIFKIMDDWMTTLLEVEKKQPNKYIRKLPTTLEDLEGIPSTN